MVTVIIEYGSETKEIEVDAPCKVLSPTEPVLRNEEDVLRECMNAPIEQPRLSEFLKGAENLLIIVNDATRATPTPRILDWIFPDISKVPDVKFLVATGTHPAPAEDDLKIIFGHYFEKIKDRVQIHDSENLDNLVSLGTTTRGTEVRFNKLAANADRIITVSGVEPHYFAGYSGGRKSFLPGIAWYGTVEKNHSHALDPDSYPLALDGNPVHEDMVEAVGLLGTDKVFTIQTVMADGHIYAAFCGDIHAAFHAAVEKANEVFCCPLAEKADIVVTCVPPPKDINLYQSQHALENGKLALKKDGIIIWVSKSRKGVGNDAFLRLLNDAENYDDIKETLRQGYKLGYHKAAKIMELNTWAEIWTVTGLEDALIRNAKMKPYGDIQTAIDDAINFMKAKGREPTVVVMPKGGTCVPFFIDG